MVALVLSACSADGATSGPTAPVAGAALLDRGESHDSHGSSLPKFDLNVELRGSHDGEGSIKFRQPNDGVTTIYLDTKIEGLQRDHDYYLQRAAETLGTGCLDQDWLTLGMGNGVETPIHTNRGGEGRATLFRTLPASLIGTAYDIHFQIIDAVTGTVVLRSPCYQYAVNGN